MQVTKNIHAIKHQFQIPVSKTEVIDRFVYSYAILGEYITLIDTGIKMSYKTIYKYLEGLGRHPGEIDKLILSHAHPDHMGSAQKIKKDTGCVVFAHENELDWFENIEIQFNDRPIPGFFKFVDRAVEVDILLEEGDRISPTGFGKIQILHTPGHSPGSLSLFFPKQKALFVGDTISLPGDIPNYHNYHQLINSLERLRELTGYNILLSSWHEPVFGEDEIKRYLYNGISYLQTIDEAVKTYYVSEDDLTLKNCISLVKVLGLPDVCINPIVNRAFRSHFAV